MIKKNSILTVILLVALTSLQAQNWTKIGSDIDGEAANDQSGESVSISADGSVVAIGAIYNDGTSTDEGHVRVYQNQSGIWTQIGSDIDGEAYNNLFGCSVSLSADGSVVAIGANYSDGSGPTGYVRVYQNISGTWTQIGSDIDGEAARDNFGYSVSLSANGSIVAIGAIDNDGNGTSAGHVRVYQNQSGTWTQIGSDIDGEAAEDNFGWSVSLSANGSIVAIGATHNDGNGSDAGHVRVYQNQSGTWTQIGSDIDGEAADDNSGTSVSLSADGSIVAIGSPFNAGNGQQAGHVRVYKNQSGTWTQIGSDIVGTAFDWSGYSVSLSANGSVVAIGSPFNDGSFTDAGHVRVYKNQSDTWTQIGSDIDGEAAEDRSGWSVSLSADSSVVAIGTPFNDGTGSDAGHVRVYHTVNTPTTIIGVKPSGISIYPNPTSGKLIVDNKQLTIKNIEITDITGKTTINSQLSVDNSQINIDLSDLNRGIYFVKISTDNEIFTTKIVKN